MQAFKIRKGNKILDYRRSEPLELESVRKDFSKKFEVVDIRQPGRHVIMTIVKNGHECILKLASTEGIGARTEIEKVWNEEFNNRSESEDFRVAKNLDDGYYNGLYYLIVEKFTGQHLSTLRGGNNIVEDYIDKIILFSEHIQSLPLNIPNQDLIESDSPQEWFFQKTKSWYESVSPNVLKEYGVDKILSVVEKGSNSLLEKPRHGDFTPWHMLALKTGGLALIDGEHAHSHGVEYYDIAYFVQRIFSVLDRRDQAEKIVEKLKNGKIDMQKFKTVLLSRAVGGFCDENLSPVPNFEKAKEFSDFSLNL